eukprot:5229756-Prymnesium_polylepis.1
MSEPQLLKRKWSEEMTRNVRAHGSRYTKVCESRGETGNGARKRATKFCPKASKAAKVAIFWEA